MRECDLQYHTCNCELYQVAGDALLRRSGRLATSAGGLQAVCTTVLHVALLDQVLLDMAQTNKASRHKAHTATVWVGSSIEGLSHHTAPP